MTKEKFEDIIRCIADEHEIDKGLFTINQDCLFESNYYIKYRTGFVRRLEPGDTIDTRSYGDYRCEFYNKRFSQKDMIYYEHLDNIKIFTVTKQYKESELVND